MTEPLALPTPSAEEAVGVAMDVAYYFGIDSRNTDDARDALIARLESAEQAAIEWQARYEAKCRAYDVLDEFVKYVKGNVFVPQWCSDQAEGALFNAEEAGRHPFP